MGAGSGLRHGKRVKLPIDSCKEAFIFIDQVFEKINSPAELSCMGFFLLITNQKADLWVI